MSTKASTKDLRSQQVSDLQKELRAQQTIVRKMRIELTLNTEKDSARYRRERKQLARIETVLSEKRAMEGLKTSAKTATVPRLRPSDSGVQAAKSQSTKKTSRSAK